MTIKERIAQATSQGRKAVIPYITAGYPNMGRFWYELKEIDESGVDIIEIGVPFSDPVADGPVIEKASHDAIMQGVTLEWLLEGLQERKGLYQAKLVLMGYLNPFMQYGYERLADAAAKAGISAFIIPDAPLEETVELRAAFTPRSLSLITLVGPNTSLERMKEYAPYTEGFVYVVSVLGTTGRNNQDIEELSKTMRRAREAFGDTPLSLGFGLDHPDQLRSLPEDCQPDAAVLGTSLMLHIESGKPVADFLAPWLSAGQ